MNLHYALRLSSHPRLAFVGAGGKTTALFQLARGFSGPVLVTTTTHLAAEQLAQADRRLTITSPADLASLETALPPGVTTLTGLKTDEKRTAGLDAASLEKVLRLADLHRAPLLIESDGSRRRPLKAPADHEPPIPGFVDTVVVVAGMSSLGQPLTEENVHRPERYISLSGLTLGETITLEAMAKVLLHPQGGLKNIPPGARRVALLNQADTPSLQAAAQSLAQRLLPAYHAVLIAALTPPDLDPNEGEGQVFSVHEPVAGIVLAAGGSRRMGEPKQILDWRGQPLVRHTARIALEAGLNPVIVVIGAYAEQVETALEGLPLTLAHNPGWEAGQSGSVQAGLRAIPPETGAAIFLLVDQPKVTSTLLRALVETHSRTLAPIVAPEIDGRRGNPVLFDRSVFPDFEGLTGDTGGRALFSKHRLTLIPWLDPYAGMDVDTPEDYDRLLDTEE